MGIIRHVFLAAALAAPLVAAPAASADQFTCRVEGLGEPSPATAPIGTDLSTDLETGRLELRTSGECVVERNDGTRTTKTVQLNASLDYRSSLCGSPSWDGLFWLSLSDETLNGNMHAMFTAGAGELEFFNVTSTNTPLFGSGLGAASIRPVSGDCVLRPVDRIGFAGAFHIRDSISF
jgi:hypothetical protein